MPLNPNELRKIYIAEMRNLLPRSIPALDLDAPGSVAKALVEAHAAATVAAIVVALREPIEKQAAAFNFPVIDLTSKD